MEMQVLIVSLSASVSSSSLATGRFLGEVEFGWLRLVGCCRSGRGCGAGGAGCCRTGWCWMVMK